jgi:hypothetical protein
MKSSLTAFVAAFWLAALVLGEVDAESFGRYGIAFAPRSRNLVQHSNLFINIRGGATLSNDDEEEDDDEIDLDEEEEDEEDEEEDEDVEDEEELQAALAAKAALKAASTVKKSAKSKAKKSAAKEGLAASTVKASTKSKTQKAAAAKEAVNVNLLSSSATSHASTKTKKKKKSSLLKMLHIPYIIGACLNPITLFKMTKGFWVSLFDLDYLKQVRMNLLFSLVEVTIGY